VQEELVLVRDAEADNVRRLQEEVVVAHVVGVAVSGYDEADVRLDSRVSDQDAMFLHGTIPKTITST
jgi:hypothetical protein